MEGIAIRTYRTRDFRFVATLLSLPKEIINVKLDSIEPFRYKGTPDKEKDLRVTMYLVAVKDGKIYDAFSDIQQMQIKYINGDLQVEPRRFTDTQAALRSMLVDNDPNADKKPKGKRK